MEKSHVSMEQKMCPVCGKVFDSGSILLDTRLRQSMERNTTTGYDLCPEHKEKWEQGYIALVVCDPTKSAPMGNNMKIEDAYRTGEVIHVRKSMADKMFNAPLDKPMAFIVTEVTQMLKDMMPKEEDKNDTRTTS